MIIDCDRCEVRGDACGSCVIGVLMEVPEEDRPIPYLPVDPPGAAAREPVVAAAGPARVSGGPSREPVEFSEPERRALQVLAEQGLIPHLRLVEGARTPGPVEQPDLGVAPVQPLRRRFAG
ncbi:hypothetical protein [Pseudonocardia phyllosphaerae]|uniref:hypothetical protein n=1 Tax=Pseudonocardia phyllosphaerae TaxID=3390502 RepID=UPI00397913A0